MGEPGGLAALKDILPLSVSHPQSRSGLPHDCLHPHFLLQRNISTPSYVKNPIRSWIKVAFFCGHFVQMVQSRQIPEARTTPGS
jgi:hypothetical protein